MLIIFGGLPGVGKTSIARALAQKIGAVHLRIDTIEQAILDAGVPLDDDIGPVGYMVANRQATDNLKLGLTVIGDAVNSVEETRSEWRLAAERASKPYVQIELICSDPGEHRHRVETRPCDIENLHQPDWDKVLGRHYEPWHGVDLIIDTAKMTVDQAVDAICGVIDKNK
ncbi:AAA family ATPase [Thalassospira xiamenensis]|uniref:AAA family ATPase n=1 Tax=Thalassospira xiamenensis TaxID=220697 RepID=UPI000DEDA530|nr:AAA family ATPase [Thalassospira xiamenensis]RCK40333.1 adenylylsulfate kinase [Thalassospira xiamenensis]